MIETEKDLEALENLSKSRDLFFNEINKVVIGQKQILEQLFIALLSNGHTLLVGVPGLAKTLIIKTFSEVLDMSFKRIQFTPDLMPSDITGTELIDFDQETIQLHVGKLDVSNINSVKDAQNREVLTFDVSIKNPLSMPLENVKLSIDEPYGDRTQKVGKLDVGAVLKKSIKVPIVKKKWSKKVNQRCVIVSAYANELFAMSGWENTVCYDEAKSKEKLNEDSN